MTAWTEHISNWDLQGGTCGPTAEPGWSSIEHRSEGQRIVSVCMGVSSVEVASMIHEWY
jgi:hypothetical protein